jgi:predicted ATP-binding protein involved in virulence
MAREERVRLLELSLTRVGPFDDAHIRFLEGADDPRRVALLTGENGTGKTVVIDAIRTAFGEEYARIERDLARPFQTLEIQILTDRHSQPLTIGRAAKPNWSPTSGGRPFPVTLTQPAPWVADYWSAHLASDPHTIEALKPREPKKVLLGSLQGTYSNTNVTQELCYIDYLRDSRNSEERAQGEALWRVIERIVQHSLLEGGRLVDVERSTFTPMVEQAGHRVPLANLSSGNAYLIGRMLTLLGRMYTIRRLRGEDPATAAELPGLLLIDEAENHLHPKWQKRFLPAVLDVFPNLQIIATTHSPFVLSSIPDARVFVCRYDRHARTCTVTEEGGDFARQPVDEILASPAFDETAPFGSEISELLAERDRAMADGNTPERKRIEARLKELNPTYFGYLDLQERVAELRARK